MNFFNKRKRNEDHEEDKQLVQPSKKSRVVSLVKKVGQGIREKLAVAVKALTTRTYTQEVRSSLFTTPAGPLRSARYIMTPLEPFSVKKSALEWRQNSYYVYDSVIPVTESRHHEFKTGGGNYPISILPEHIRKYGSAFLNSDGGVLMAGILDNGKVRGIRCNDRMRRRIIDTVEREFADFLPKVPPTLYRVKFIPVIYKQTPFERREGRYTYVTDVFVIEIAVKAGEKEELYETGKHKVFIRRESSVQGPLNPLQIKDIVISKYRAKIQGRRIAKLAEKDKEKETSPKVKAADKSVAPKPVKTQKTVIVVSP